MEKLLSILAVSTFTLTTATNIPNTFNLNSNINNFKTTNNLNTPLKTNLEDNQGINKQLNVDAIKQEKNNFCVPAVIQMILSHISSDARILQRNSQTRIFNNLGGDEHGVVTDERVSQYINNGARSDIGDNPYYHFSIAQGYGRSSADLQEFQDFVHVSLNNNRPVIVGYSFEPGAEEEGHAILIVGMETDSAYSNNPRYTRYSYINPGNANMYQITGNDIYNAWTHYGPVDIFGSAEDFDMNNDEVEIKTPAGEEASWRGDVSEGTTYVRSAWIDATDKIGVTNPSALSTGTNKFLLPEYSLDFSWAMHSYSYHRNDNYIPSQFINNLNYMNWMSNYGKCDTFWVSFYPYIGVISLYLYFSVIMDAKISYNNHLLISLLFKIDVLYRGLGAFAAPYAHVDLDSGSKFYLKY